MNRYSIQYHSRTQVALTKLDKQQTLPLPGWVFNFPVEEVKIFLFDATKRTDDVNLHTGLNLTTVLKANSLEEAKETSKNFVETTLNLVSFSTLTSCSPAKLASIMDVPYAHAKAYPFIHYAYPFDEQEIIGSLSVIDEPAFRELFDAYTRSPNQQRTLRASTWLRKGIGEENSVDEFISYWIGLEVIKHVLSPEKMNTDKEWGKVEEVFTEKLHFQNFKKIRQDGRNGLLHGFRQLDNEFVKEIESYVEPIRKTLIFCLGNVLCLRERTTIAIANKAPRRIRQSPWTVLEGLLKNMPKDFDRLVKNYPMIDYEKANKKFSIDKSGELSMTFPVTYRFHGPSDAKWEVKAIELWGDKDAGIKHMKFKG